MTTTKFGKSSGPLLKLKQGFFDANASLLEEGTRLSASYLEQPKREACKCCNGPMAGATFTKKGIEYLLCDRCGHLNGIYEDTDAFCDALYMKDGGADYSKNYSSADREAYKSRVEQIYQPKADFLKDGLAAEGLVSGDQTFADFGAGSGYFIAALRAAGCLKSKGYEVSKTQARLASEMIGDDAIFNHALEDVLEIAGSVEADVASMIGVLEHVQWPREVLAALQSNRNVRYLYISVPLFSPCVALEAVFPNVFQRQLSAGHTHLYTEKSLEWTRQEFGLESVAEWWFGTDIVDLFRLVTVELERNEETRLLSQKWGEWIAPAIDEMQLALDRKKLASEVHMLMRFER